LRKDVGAGNSNYLLDPEVQRQLQHPDHKGGPVALSKLVFAHDGLGRPDPTGLGVAQVPENEY
jgi:hypothetical protein